MEKIPAACAMEWSILFEKSLRSKIPGKSIEAIREIGPKLEWWNNEPTLTMAEYTFFGLIPGEDKLFANAILLRLADAFCYGDKQTKLCVVKVFLSEYKHRKKMGRNDGILSRSRFPNYLEALRRVKLVFETGDVEVRAMGLAMFGYWADFAHDSPEIRYFVLSSAVSTDVSEVKASLFAAGCFCELSDDFASVLMELVVNIVSSSEASMALRLAGVRVLAKMGCLYSLASSAYKAGLKLVTDSSEEDLSVAMLIALSKISTKSTLLISTQVEVLFSFLSQDKSLRSQVTSLKCLHFMLTEGAHNIHVSASAIRTILRLLNEPRFPPAVQCKVLRILHKILIQNLFKISCPDMLEFLSELLTFVENGIQSSTISERLLATYVLVDAYKKFMGRAETKMDRIELHCLASRTITFIVDRIYLLVKAVVELHLVEFEIKQEVRSLLNLLFNIIEACSDFGSLVLDKVQFLLKFLVDKHNRVMDKVKVNLSGHESLRGESKTDTIPKLILYICRVLIYCLERIDMAGALTAQVHFSLKLLVQDLQNFSFLDCYIHTVYSLLFWFHFTCYPMQTSIEENNNLDNNLGVTDHNGLVQHEIFTLECSKKLLAKKDYWLAYKAGRYAAYRGAWFVAAFIFYELIKMVKSHPCSCWLKSLSEYACSEIRVQLLVLPKQGAEFLNQLESCGIYVVPSGNDLYGTGERTASSVSSSHHIENLTGACKIIHSSLELLRATSRDATDFGFQRWWLSLRAKVLETVVDLLRFLSTIPLTEDRVNSIRQVSVNNMVKSPGSFQNINSLSHPLSQISLRLKRLAQEFDLVGTSFFGVDCRSLLIISSLALSCSLLAFSTGVSLFLPNLQAVDCLTNSGSGKCENSLYSMLILDLLSRLWHVDHETSAKLMLLLNACGQSGSHFTPHSRNHILDTPETRSIIKLCSSAVTRVIGLQTDENRMHHDMISQLTVDDSHFLLSVIMKWMKIPLQVPMYFFCIRRPLCSQFFASSRDARHGDGLSISRGFHLSLNICLQLRNMPPDLPAQLTKMYCIVSTRISFLVPCPSREKAGQAELGFQDWGTDDVLDMNEKLVQYATGNSNSNIKNIKNAGDREDVEVFVRLKSNAKGQGFSTCLLDVSAFPVGSYRIKWHSCCIDNEGSFWNLLPLNPGPILTVE